jgi:hypothetical protein
MMTLGHGPGDVGMAFALHPPVEGGTIMKTQHVCGASAATMLAVAMAAFAQAPQSSPPATPAGQSSDKAQASQSGRQAETPVTLVGCVMREADYRKSADAGKGGPVGTGLGRGDEFVLVNAKKTTAGAASTAKVDCSAATTAGEAFELSGSGEKNAAQYVGRAVEVSGTLKSAKTEAGPPAGEAKPTGGFDPLKQDLKLFEVDVTSVRPLVTQGAAAAPNDAPAAAPEPAAQAAQPPTPAASPVQSASPAQQSAARNDLPRTASPLPVIGLVGLLAFASGLALRRRA